MAERPLLLSDNLDGVGFLADLVVEARFLQLVRPAHMIVLVLVFL